MGKVVIWVTPTVACRGYCTPANGRYVSKISGDPLWITPVIDEECWKWSGEFYYTNWVSGPTYMAGLQMGKTWSRNPNTRHSVWVGGQIIDWQCSVSVAIPTCPTGMYLYSVEYYDQRVGGEVNTNRNYWSDPGFDDRFVHPSSFSFEPDNLTGSSAGWRTLNQPTDGVDWRDSASITPAYMSFPAVKFVYRWEDDVDPTDPCAGIEAANITANGATLSSSNYPDAWWQWGVEGDNVGQTSATGVLTGLEPGHKYWYKLLSYCETKTFWFETEDEEDWSAAIVTLPATEVWATGATIHGELVVAAMKNPHTHYCYLGFQYGLKDDVSAEPIRWVYSGRYGPGRHPIQLTIAGLLPDRTYYYRACLHVGAPPFGANEYFGATLSFGGPVSILGVGRQHVTAKQAEDSISKLAAGRYYSDKAGVLQYESAQRRKA